MSTADRTTPSRRFAASGWWLRHAEADPALGGFPRPDLLVFALAVTIKLALLWLDPYPRFFFGDSASYLHAAISGWVPPDRSPTLPLILRHTAVAAGSLGPWLLLQTLVGAMLAWLLFHWLHRELRVRLRWAVLAAVLLCVEPMQLYYERSVMAETFGTAALLAQLACAVAYLRSKRVWWLLPAALFGLAAVSFRLNLLPVVLVLSVLLPLLHLFGPTGTRPRWRSLGVHVLIALAATWALHTTYQHWNGARLNTAPGYTANIGLFRLGWLAPLLTPAQLERQGLSPDWLDTLSRPVTDLRSREWHLWSEEGLISRLRRDFGEDTDRVANKLSKRILRESPWQVIGLGLRTLGDHFDADYARDRMDNDLGRNRPPDGFHQRMQEHLGDATMDWRRLDAPATRWFAASRPVLSAGYFLLLALAPIGIWLAWWRRDPVQALFAFSALGLTTAYALFGHILVFRYLHPMAPLLLLLLACAASRGAASIDDPPSGQR